MKKLISFLVLLAMLVTAINFSAFADTSDEKAVEYIGYQVKDNDARLVFGIRNTDISTLTGLGAVITNKLDGGSATVTNCEKVYTEIYADSLQFNASTEGFNYLYLIVFTDMFVELDTHDFIINPIYTTANSTYMAGEQAVNDIDQAPGSYTVISSWSKIEETGKYRLKSDIGTESEPNSTQIASFSGTIDGNGYTVHTTTNLFGTLNEGANIISIAIDGSVTKTTAIFGMLATYVKGTSKIINVVNNADITITSPYNKANVGGLIGEAQTGISLVGCINNGAIAFNGDKSVYGFGGIIGESQDTIALNNCQNNGTITANTTSSVEGLAGIVGYVSSGESISLTNCENTAELKNCSTNGTMYAGGIVGWLNANLASFTNCRNSGNITHTRTEDSTGFRNGGIVGIAYTPTSVMSKYHFIGCCNIGTINSLYYAGGIGGEVKGNLLFVSCVNNGDVISSTTATVSQNKYAGGIIGVLAANSAAVEKCVNYGDIKANGIDTKETYAGGIVAGHNVGITLTDCANYSENITSQNGYTGGIVARANSTLTINKAFTVTSACIGATTNTTATQTVTNCYYVGKDNITLDSFKGETAKTTLVGFDFDEVWTTVDDGYPVLR